MEQGAALRIGGLQRFTSIDYPGALAAVVGTMVRVPGDGEQHPQVEEGGEDDDPALQHSGKH